MNALVENYGEYDFVGQCAERSIDWTIEKRLKKVEKYRKQY